MVVLREPFPRCKHDESDLCFADTICRPMVNMLDDHDLIDGFGSYSDDLQRSAFFKQFVCFWPLTRYPDIPP